MIAPLARALAIIRARPALAIAGAGVAVVAGIPFLGRLGNRDAGPPAAPAAATAGTPSPSGLGFGAGLTGVSAPGDLAVGSVVSAYGEGNALILGELGRLRDMIAGAAKPPVPPAAIMPKPVPMPILPVTKPAPTPVATDTGLSAAQVAAILRATGHDPARNSNWNPPYAATRGERILREWIAAREADRRRGVPGWDY
jgi:hypothetical protein